MVASLRALMIATVTVLAGPAVAQDAAPEGEWDLIRTGQDDLAAVTAFTNGLIIATRCQENVFEVLIDGLPPSEGLPAGGREGIVRLLRLRHADDGDQDTTTPFYIGEPSTVAFAALPAMLARNLREGGELQLVAPGEGSEATRRYILPLPASPAAIDQTLNACGLELEDPRDALLAPEDALRETPADRSWERPPQPRYPSQAMNYRIPRGVAVVSCVMPASGRPSDCQIESEYPARVGFGRAALHAAQRARMTPKEGEATRLVMWGTHFMTP